MVYQPNFILGLSPSHNRMCLLLVCCPFSGPWILAKYCGFPFGLVCVCFSFWLLRSLDYLFPLFDASFPYEFHHISVFFFEAFFHYYSESFALNTFCVCPEFSLIPRLIRTNCFGCPTFVSFGVCLCVGLVVARCVFLLRRLDTHTLTRTHTHIQRY